MSHGTLLVQWHRDAPAARGCSAPHAWAQRSGPAARAARCTHRMGRAAYAACCTCCTCCTVHAAHTAHLRPPRALAEGAQSEGSGANCRKPRVLLCFGRLIASCKRWALTGVCGHLHVALGSPQLLHDLRQSHQGGWRVRAFPKLLPLQTCPEQCAAPGTGKINK